MADMGFSVILAGNLDIAFCQQNAGGFEPKHGHDRGQVSNDAM
jgi:hypothetical protein